MPVYEGSLRQLCSVRAPFATADHHACTKAERAAHTCCAVPGSAGTSKLDRSRPLLSARERFFLLMDLRRPTAEDGGATKYSEAPLPWEESAIQARGVAARSGNPALKACLIV